MKRSRYFRHSLLFLLILQSLNHLEVHPLRIIFSSLSCCYEKYRISVQSSVVVNCWIRKVRLLHHLHCFFVELLTGVVSSYVAYVLQGFPPKMVFLGNRFSFYENGDHSRKVLPNYENRHPSITRILRSDWFKPLCGFCCRYS